MNNSHQNTGRTNFRGLILRWLRENRESMNWRTKWCGCLLFRSSLYKTYAFFCKWTSSASRFHLLYLHFTTHNGTITSCTRDLLSNCTSTHSSRADWHEHNRATPRTTQCFLRRGEPGRALPSEQNALLCQLAMHSFMVATRDVLCGAVLPCWNSDYCSRYQCERETTQTVMSEITQCDSLRNWTCMIWWPEGLAAEFRSELAEIVINWLSSKTITFPSWLYMFMNCEI
jgi:hypothetical protein